MLDEYIQEQITRLGEEKQYLSEKLNRLTRQEQEEQEELTQMMDTEDVGVELFSPRAVNNGINRQISRIKQHVEDLRVQQTGIRQKLEQTIKNEKKYRQMYEESHDVQRQVEEAIADRIARENAEDMAEVQDNTEVLLQEKEEKIKQLEHELEELRKKNAEQEKMIGVLRGNVEGGDTVKQEKNQERRAELNEISKRIEKAFHAAQIDRIKCKDELKKLKKYMAELIGK